MAFIINNNFCNCIQIPEDTQWILILFLIYFLRPVAPSRADLHSQRPFCPEILSILQSEILMVLGTAWFQEYYTSSFALLLETEGFFFPLIAFSYLFLFYKDFPLIHPLSLY